MKRIAIIGSGDLGQQIAYHVTHAKQYEVFGFFDDFEKKNTIKAGYKILGAISEVEPQYENDLFDALMMGIGYKHLEFRASVFERFQSKIPFASFVHPSCFVDDSCKIGEGVFMLPGSVLDQNVIVGDNVLINVGCTIAHDTTIQAHSFLSPRVALAGFVTIGKRCNIGINAAVVDSVSISDDIQLGGGTVVITNLEDKGLYVGNPSRFVR